MVSLADLIRSHLEPCKPASADTPLLVRDLLTAIEAGSLNVKIRAAFKSKKEGRIDQSIVLITQANREQLDAVKAIEKMLARIQGRPEQEIIFSKFRQTFPFEMDIENGDYVVALINDFSSRTGDEGDAQRARLHALEDTRSEQIERLEFFETRFTDGTEDGTIEEIGFLIREIDDELSALRVQLLAGVLVNVKTMLARQSADGLSTDGDQLIALSKWLFTLVASPTATKSAKAPA